jgi:hypothetical protein
MGWKCLICVRRCESRTAYGGVVNEQRSPGSDRAAEQETKVKKIIALATAVVALAIPATSLAANGNASPSNNPASDSGIQHGAFAVDYGPDGNFGFLGGLGGTPYYNGSYTQADDEKAVGQDQGATGYNNSHVNGNVAA